MDQSYIKSGVGNQIDYKKHIKEALEELQQSQSFSKLELTRNLFQPDKSLFMEGKSRLLDNLSTKIEDEPSSQLIKDAQGNIDLTRSILDYIDEHKEKEKKMSV